MVNIVVPMAGRGSRFANAGFETPKPLIDVGGRPMIDWVINNIKPNCDHRFIFICQQEHLEKYPQVRDVLMQAGSNSVIVPINGVTEGPACTVLLAKEYFNNTDPLMIANSDQFVDCDINQYLSIMQEADGLIMTFEAHDPKWSFCKMNPDGSVAQVVEKEVVSDIATVGIYNYACGSDFVHAAQTMIDEDFRVNGEFYVAPVYNWMIKAGRRVIVSQQRGMYGLGVPEDLDKFKQTDIYEKHCSIA